MGEPFKHLNTCRVKKCTNKNKIFNISYFKRIFNLLHSISMPFLSDSIEEWLTKNNNGDYSCSRTLDCCNDVEAYCVHNRWCIIVHRMRCTIKILFTNMFNILENIMFVFIGKIFHCVSFYFKPASNL